MITAQEFIQYLDRGEIPPEPPTMPRRSYDPGWSMDSRVWRVEATDRGMWAIVDQVWTKQLADWIGNRKCLEIMAGAGWLAKALFDYGVDIIATDNGNWDTRHSKMRFMHPVERLDAISAIQKYQDAEILICSWPPYDEDDFVEACEEWGNQCPIIYIGEDKGGCNATDEFFENFYQIDHPDFDLQRWDGIHDYVQIGYYDRG